MERSSKAVQADPQTTAGTESYRTLATEAIESWIPKEWAQLRGEPEIQPIPNTSDPGAITATWRSDWRDLDDLDFTFSADVIGGKLVRLAVQPQLDGDWVQSKLATYERWNQIGNIVRILFLTLGPLYGLFSFIRRAREQEAPYTRSFTLAGLVLLFGAMVFIVDPNIGQQTLNPDQLAGWLTPLIRVAAFMFIALQGLVIGIAYGATEGDIREHFPGKLISLDAILSGRILARQVGTSVVIGAACAGWLLLALKASVLAFGPEVPLDGRGPVGNSFSRMPWLVLLISSPTVAVFSTVAALMLPLAFLVRHPRSKLIFWPVLLLCALLGSHIGEPFTVYSHTYWLESAAFAFALLVGFQLGGIFSAIISYLVLIFLAAVLDLPGIASVWQSYSGQALVAALVAGIPFVLAAWFGRSVDEEEVRPVYARNITSRLSMQAELNTAREAQLRLLPRSMPKIPGLSIAASLTPAREVGGDYYDFFSLEGNRLGFVVAEGGNDGLASALTIALAKGFLLYEVRQDRTPAETLQALESVLGSMLRRSAARTSLFFAVLDPLRMVLDWARVGTYPRAILLQAGGDTQEVTSREITQALQSGTVSVTPGEAVVVFTDGFQQMLGRLGNPDAAQMLKRTAAFHSIPDAPALQSALHTVLLNGQTRLGDLTDDLTYVVVRYQQSATRVSEMSA